MGSTQVGDHWGSPRADYFFKFYINLLLWNRMFVLRACDVRVVHSSLRHDNR